MDVAKDNPADAALPERPEHAAEYRLVVVRMGMGLEQRNAEGRSLVSDEFPPDTMKSYPSAGALIDIEQVRDIKALTADAI